MKVYCVLSHLVKDDKDNTDEVNVFITENDARSFILNQMKSILENNNTNICNNIDYEYYKTFCDLAFANKKYNKAIEVFNDWQLDFLKASKHIYFYIKPSTIQGEMKDSFEPEVPCKCCKRKVRPSEIVCWCCGVDSPGKVN